MIKYKKLIIYYFSGTGNAKATAYWIAKVAIEHDIETQLINIDRFKEIEKPDIKEKTLIGFCSPTHGFNLAPIMLNYILKFQPNKNTDVFILNTRAGMKLNKFFLPGLSGAAQFLPAIILKLKGYSIVGMQPMDLPSNWLLIHPALKEKVVNSIFNRCQRKTIIFAEKILNGKKSYKALLSLPIDLLITPIAILYYFIGRYFLAKTLITSSNCNLCKKCINECPLQAINIVKNRPFWSYKCESCMRCVNNCPQRAIETTQSFSLFLIIISSLLITPAIISLLKIINIWNFINTHKIAEGIWQILDAAIFLLIVFLSYRLLHFLMKFKFLNKIIVYTFLSNYKFWRRYRSPKNL